MKKLLLVIPFIFCVSTFLFSQDESGTYFPTTIPASPGMQAFNKVVDVPVDYYTGSVPINIDLFKLQVGTIELPISIQYTSTGVKVSEVASSVGLSWNLNVPFNINRSISGFADDFNGQQKGYFYNSRFFVGNNPNPDILSECYLLYDDNGDPYFYAGVDGVLLTTLDSLRANYFDVMPDVFYYHLLNDAGKFVFDLDRNPQLLEYSDSEILYHPFLNGYDKWTLKTADNHIYTFLEKEQIYNTIDCGSGPGPFPPRQETSAWLVSSIKSGLDEINFIYENNTIQHDTRISDKMSTTDGGFYQFSVCSSQSIFDSKQLNSIIGNNGVEVVFRYDSSERSDLLGGHALSEIEIFKTGVSIQKIHFYQSYFGNSSKLKLDSVKFEYENDKMMPGYLFDYNSPSSVPDVDSRSVDFWGYFNGANNSHLLTNLVFGGNEYTFTTDRDANFSSCLAGSLKSITYPTGGKREFSYELNEFIEPNQLVSITKQLKLYEMEPEEGGEPGVIQYGQPFEIKQSTFGNYSKDNYPEGPNDFVKFQIQNNLEFEDYPISSNGTGLDPGIYRFIGAIEHQVEKWAKIVYTQRVDKTIRGGGLRIREISEWDHTNQIISKKIFEYDLNSKSSGFYHGNYGTKGSLSYHFPHGQMQEVCPNYDTPTETLTLEETRDNPNFLKTGYTGYTHVTVMDLDEYNQSSNGKTEYFFENKRDGALRQYPLYFPNISEYHLNGRLKEEIIYRTGDPSFIPLRRKSISYNTGDNYQNVPGFNAIFNSSSFCYKCHQADVIPYVLNQAWGNVSSTVEEYYNDEGVVALSKTIENTYDANVSLNLPISTQEIYSDSGNVRKTVFHRNTQAVGQILGKEEFINDSKVAGLAFTYSDNKVELVKKWNPDVSIEIAPGKTTSYERIRKNTFDQNGNPIFTEGINMTNAFFWENFDLVAVIDNVTESNCYYTSFEGDYGTDYSFAFNGSQVFNSGSIDELNLSLEGSNLKMSFWEFDSVNGWIYQSDIPYSDNYTFSSPIDDLIIYPENAEFKVYHYFEWGGVKRIIDSNGKHTLYEYDDLRRLKVVKDHENHILRAFDYTYKQN